MPDSQSKCVQKISSKLVYSAENDNYLKNYECYKCNENCTSCTSNERCSSCKENYILTEAERTEIKEKIYTRKNYLKTKYNWFADFEAGDIRHRVLLLYRKIITLVYDIDSLNSDLNTMPQQSLVILMQLMNHSRFMLEAFLNVEEIDSSEIVNYGA